MLKFAQIIKAQELFKYIHANYICKYVHMCVSMSMHVAMCVCVIAFPCVCVRGSECAPAFSISLQLMSGGPPLQQAWQSLAVGPELAVFSW